jgi:hypothetical protein
VNRDRESLLDVAIVLGMERGLSPQEIRETEWRLVRQFVERVLNQKGY